MLKLIWYPFGIVLAAVRLVLLIGSMALTVCIGVILVKLKIADQQLAFRIRTFWSRLAMKILGVRLHMTGNVDHTEGTLYIGNHRTYMDPFIAFAFINNGYVVSKSEVSGYPLVHTGAKLSGVIYVIRDNSHSRNNAKNTILNCLKEKKSVVLFPEGTVSIHKQTLPFKKGSFEAAAETQRPVVAFAIEVGNPQTDIWRRDGLLSQFFITNSKWCTDIYLHFFDPVIGDDGAMLCEKCEKKINDKLAEFQKNWVENDR
jgi:1-acyl-sn-glycerol-3-phosphate acyltransferase